MRSSKSRSRSKSNRPRTLGNIVNRVFDSSGPEGKVRGTPQQIIEKYLVLARDAQLSNDRVAAENFLQHAEHYTRMLGEAQREMQRDEASRGGPQDGSQRDQNHNGQQSGQGGGQPSQQQGRQWRDADGQPESGAENRGGEHRRDTRRGPRRDDRRDDRPRNLRPARNEDPSGDDGGPSQHDSAGLGAEVIELGPDAGESTLVETPEARGPRPRRKPRGGGGDTPAPEAAPEAAQSDPEAQAGAVAGDAAADADAAPRRRATRKPRAAAKKADSGDAPASSAAE